MTTSELQELLTKGLRGDIPMEDLTHLLSTDRSLAIREQEMIHMLIHFTSDHDLREKDLEYDQHMRGQIDAAFRRINRT